MKKMEAILLACTTMSLVFAIGFAHHHPDNNPQGKSHVSATHRHLFNNNALAVRHIRSVDSPQSQPQQQESNELENLSIIGSSSGSGEENDYYKGGNINKYPDLYRTLRPFATLSSKAPLLHRWLFRGTPYSPQFPPRGVRRDNHFIRFGRNSADLDFATFPSGSSNNGNKKNNFIRLGRENPRRNNFIRLGRSGAGFWGNNERFGSKIGFFPDYYSQSFGGKQEQQNSYQQQAQQPNI